MEKPVEVANVSSLIMLATGEAILEKEDLLKRWNITDDKLKEFVMRGHIRVVYDRKGKRCTGFLSVIRRKINPLCKDYVLMLPEDRQYLKNEFEKIYQDIRFFNLLEINRLDIVYEALSFPKRHRKGRESNKHHAACREVAKSLWEKDRSITIADMIICDEITAACDGHNYTEKIMRGWINDLCPNRKPGRRPKIKK